MTNELIVVDREYLEALERKVSGKCTRTEFREARDIIESYGFVTIDE